MCVRACACGACVKNPWNQHLACACACVCALQSRLLLAYAGCMLCGMRWSG
jgi:hypothetical protein